MKFLVRNILINTGALWVTSQIIPALSMGGGWIGLLTGALAFMAANILLVPLVKILLLPLNLLTLGIFAWLSNVLVLYLLTTILPYFRLSAYRFEGLSYQGFIVPAINLSAFQVAIIASLLIGFIIHFINWLIK